MHSISTLPPAHMDKPGRSDALRCTPNTRTPVAAAAPLLMLLGSSLPLLLALLLLVRPASASAQGMPSASTGEPARLQEPLLPAFGGLSDGGPVLTPYIDRLAFNARVEFLFLANSAKSQQAFVIPYGFSFAALRLVEAGIFTRHTLWKEGEQSHSYNAPLSLNLKVRLWRWFAADANQHFTVVAGYQHEVRTGPFDGPNQLGLFTNLAALRIAASWPVWLFDIGTSVGALYDYQGRFAIGELGARLSVRLDFLKLDDTRASIEGIVRGLPTYRRADVLLPGAADPQNPLPLSGALFFGVNTRMTKTADFGIWAQKGFGDVAALSFGVRILGIFIGDGYLRPRSLWVDVVKAMAVWIKEQIAAIDPVFRRDCVAYDKAGKGAPDGKPMGSFGRLSEDGRFCVSRDGFRAPVDVDLWRDPKGTLLCWDEAHKDCLLRREGGVWIPIHRPRLDADCILRDSDGSWLEKLGEPSPDKTTCHWAAVDQHGRRKALELEVGRLYHADRDLRRVCYNDDLSGCFVDRSDHPTRWDGQQQAGASLRLGVNDLGGKLKKAGETAEGVANGRVNLKTIAQQAEEEAERAVDRCGQEGLDCAKRIFYGVVDAGKEAAQDAKNWWDEPTQDKINDALRKLPEAEVGAAAGGIVRAAGSAVEHELERAAAKRLLKSGEKKAARAGAHTTEAAIAKGGLHGGECAAAEQGLPNVVERLPDHRVTAPPKKRGHAPIGDDGHPVELHHKAQSPAGPVEEITRTDHRLGKNYQENHTNTGQAASQIDRSEWRKQQRGYWKQEWDKGRFDDHKPSK